MVVVHWGIRWTIVRLNNEALLIRKGEGMKYFKGIIATSHIDSQNEWMTFAALESMVEQINTQRIPMGIEHDPRIPPQGRAVSAQLEQLDDGEFAVVAISEVFEEGDEIEFRDDGREMPLREFGDDRLYIIYDKSYRDQSDQELLEEMRTLVSGETSEYVKKSLDPITVLTIAAGGFIAGNIASGFFQKVGSDAWDSFKDKLKRLIGRRRGNKSENLLLFQFVIRDADRTLSIETILSDPGDRDIEVFFEQGLKGLDAKVPAYLEDNAHLKKLVLEYADGKLKVLFGVRRDAVPIHFEEHKLLK